MTQLLTLRKGQDPRATDLILTGLMLYPYQPKAHAHWILRNAVMLTAICDDEARKNGLADEEYRASRSRWLGELVHDHGGWTVFADATIRNQTRSALDETRDRVKMGKTAGGVLLKLLLDRECNGVRHAAQKVVDEQIAHGRETGTTPRSMSWEAVYNRIWPDFRPAAHLWAALVAYQMQGGTLEPAPWLPLTHFERGGLPGFLALAEEIRQEGVGRMPRRGPRKPILPPDETWIVQQLA